MNLRRNSLQIISHSKESINNHCNTKQTPCYSPLSHQNPQNSVQDQDNSASLKYKTELCKNYSEKGNCPYRKRCQFAHGLQQLSSHQIKHSNTRFRTRRCKFYWSEGFCSYGLRCQFSHQAKISNQSICVLVTWKSRLQQNKMEGNSRLIQLLNSKKELTNI